MPPTPYRLWFETFPRLVIEKFFIFLKYGVDKGGIKWFNVGRFPTECMDKRNKQDDFAETQKNGISGGCPFGRYDHTIDAKKRLTIPALLRELLGNPDRLYVLRFPGAPCLTLMTDEEMQGRMAKLRESGKSIFDPNRANALRYIGENSEVVQVDDNGRIRICDRLMRQIGLLKDAVFIGTGLTVEVWALENKPRDDGPVDEQEYANALALVGF